MSKRCFVAALCVFFILVSIGCVSPNVKLFTDATVPLKEYTIQGKSEGKILMIPVKGIISDSAKRGILRNEPSMVQDIVSQLHLAEKDCDIKAVMFTIDSPGGSVTASDMLYHEIMRYKEKTKGKVTAVLMNVAASGGYYIALPADYIIAHPTSLTGSVGVIFLRPKLYGLMDKIGVDVAVNKSGEDKDMGSPFREATEEETAIFQELTDKLGSRFTDLVMKHRKINPEDFGVISSARVFLAQEAKDRGLVDDIGYLSDAIKKTSELAGLPENPKVVVYRRDEYPDDNLYNTQSQFSGGGINLGLPDFGMLTQPGFYYLWPAGVQSQ